jgi:hypothetical protein
MASEAALLGTERRTIAARRAVSALKALVPDETSDSRVSVDAGPAHGGACA